MALYYDAASILSSVDISGSLKSRVYSNTTLKSKPAQIYALISETAKRDVFLKEVIDNTDLLKDEPKLTPILSLLLCHDHFFAKSGIAAPVKHPLRVAVERSKARLQAEFTRARLRRKCASIAALKDVLDSEKGTRGKTHPRWARVNTIKTLDSESVTSSIHGSKKKTTLAQVLEDTETLSYHQDENIPDLFALSPTVNLTNTDSYKSGALILQDKASCFPAHLLLGDQPSTSIGDIIDACAAPGNKTTHLAAIIHTLNTASNKTDEITTKIFACERDPLRSKTLQTMLRKAGADRVEVLARQDFLALDPEDGRFARITHLLLDPSCSGSGILGREDVPRLVLPSDTRTNYSEKKGQGSSGSSKKRKRLGQVEAPMAPAETIRLDQNGDKDGDVEGEVEEESTSLPTSQDRLQKLSNLQTLIVEHAMKFPAATRITYSTCSIHEIENEGVVARVLNSRIAKERGWRVLRREEQVAGLRAWKSRGVAGSPAVDRDVAGRGTEGDDDMNGTRTHTASGEPLDQEQLDACIRCNPNDSEGTMGFFVCGFVRDLHGNIAGGTVEMDGEDSELREQKQEKDGEDEDEDEDQDEWAGFE